MSDRSQKLFEDAKDAMSSGDKSRAADLLKQVIEEEPERVSAWIELSKVVTNRDERRMALTTILQLEPDNNYARTQLESVEKAGSGGDDEGEVVPGIPRKQARTVGIGLAVYTLVVCGATLLITTALNTSKANQKAAIEGTQTQQVVAANETVTQIALAATEVAFAATQTSEVQTATQLAIASPLPSATNTRSFELPTEIPPTPTATTISYRVEALTSPLTGHLLAWGGQDVRSKEFLALRDYDMSQPGTFTLLVRELGRNPLVSLDKSVTVYEQWRQDGSRLYITSLDPVTPGGTLDALVSGSYLVVELHDPSISADAKRVAFIAVDYNTKVSGAYLADISDPNSSKFYKLAQDTASYTAITLSPDGKQAVAVRESDGSSDLVVFDLTNLDPAGNPVRPPAPTALPTNAAEVGTPAVPLPTVAVATGSSTIPVRPLTTDGNTLIEGSPSFSPDGTRVVYDAASSSAPDNRDLYMINVGAVPGTAQPIMTLDGNDIFPTFSPDGNLVAFSSDRQTGIYNIYIFDTISRTTTQLTEESSAVYPSFWTN